MKLKVFVRWDKSHDDAGGTVEVTQENETIIVWSKRCGNNDRVYGYCMAVVDMLRFQDHEIDMPQCLKGHLCPDRERED